MIVLPAVFAVVNAFDIDVPAESEVLLALCTNAGPLGGGGDPAGLNATINAEYWLAEEKVCVLATEPAVV